MVEVVVIAEGPTEEKFVKELLAPAFNSSQIFLKPLLLKTSQDARGGAVSFDRLKFNARNTLRQKPDAVLTTLLDLYGLDTDFPGFADAKKLKDVYSRVKALEAALLAAIVEHVGCRPERFIPYIQPYEFEGLLFSDVDALVLAEPTWKNQLTKLQAVRAAFETPEHINDSYETKPSRRLENILSPKYKKTRHGPLAAERVTLSRMEQECAHFRGWMTELRGLSA